MSKKKMPNIYTAALLETPAAKAALEIAKATKFGAAVAAPPKMQRTPPGYEEERLAIRTIVMGLVAEIAKQHEASDRVNAQDYTNRFSDACQGTISGNIKDSDLRRGAIERVKDILGKILYPPDLDKQN